MRDKQVHSPVSNSKRKAFAFENMDSDRHGDRHEKELEWEDYQGMHVGKRSLFSNCVLICKLESSASKGEVIILVIN